MKKLILALVILCSLVAVAGVTSIDFESTNKLAALWNNEEIYFLPQNKSDVTSWSGILYHYTTKKCFQLSQSEIAAKVIAQESKCDSLFLKKATEPYLKISDFKTYRKKLLSCLHISDEKCIRSLVSKTLQISFGVDGNQDRRDYIFETWKKEDFNRLHDLIKKGTIEEGDARTFPPAVTDEGMGYRGEFKKENGGWLLKYFLAGD